VSTNPLEVVTERAEALATHRERLGALVGALNKSIELLKADHMPELRAAITEATDSWASLEAGIRANPELFVKPRTISVHGIKFGLAKGKGSLEIANEAKTIMLIEKHFPEKADVLIDVKKTPAKDAICLLPAADLKRIGCEVKDTGDRVVIKPSDGEVDKIVKALISAAVDEAAEVAP
jgi:hypothetical protein